MNWKNRKTQNFDYPRIENNIEKASHRIEAGNKLRISPTETAHIAVTVSEMLNFNLLQLGLSMFSTYANEVIKKKLF